ncbi:MAG TPA: plastocyanin/azurin family copper-binding protein [Thermoleophilaceae bacterium]|jgi:plastocyanin|nr:plastocyanin/azurin family copper-binding protein [Thermoleophilaceae bacterium]
MSRLGFLVLIAALVAAIAAATALAATNVTWKVGTNKTVRIKKGGTVKWIWGDGQPHNVKGNGFTSKTMTGKGKSYSHRFNKAGTFKIICQVHPTTMKTTVKVS